MTAFSIALAALAVWLGFGFVFFSICLAAGRADRGSESALAGGPRTLRQHVFAVHVRSVRTMRRLTRQRGAVARSGAVRSHLHSAHAGGIHPA